MGTTLMLTSADGTRFEAYRAEPRGTPRGAVVVLQEIFGVNAHIRKVTDGFAADGFLAFAPALFDRVRPGLELSYDAAGIAKGRRCATELGWDGPMVDIQATVETAAVGGKVAVVGYCWGGSLAFRAAAQVQGIASAVGYYGAQIARMLDQVPKVPVLLHFGEKDGGIPPADVEAIRQAFPAIAVHTYPAGHAFNRDGGPSWEPTSAALARKRTLALFVQTLR